MIDEEAVFVTNDEADFDAFYRQIDLHTGLLILPQVERREALWPLLDAALDYIEQQANDEDEAPAEWMLNKRVEIDPDGSIKHTDLPDAE